MNEHLKECKEIKHAHVTVSLPNHQTLTSAKTVLLPNFIDVPPKNRIATIIPSLRQGSLMSVSKLCDADCKVIFDKDKVTVIKANKRILEGKHKHVNGSHYLNHNKQTINNIQPKTNQINMILPKTPS